MARSRYPGASTLAALLLAGFAAGGAGAQPYGFEDIRLGASLLRLAHDFDFRDLHAALAQQQEQKTAKPDFGRRGYGCVHRDDPHADVTCVSHDERVGGAEAREFRLHFLEGVLQQFSISAEMRHFDTVMREMDGRYGAPQVDAGAGPPVYHWDNGVSKIMGHGGKDLVFISFELADYANAVKRKQGGVRQNECR